MLEADALRLAEALARTLPADTPRRDQGGRLPIPARIVQSVLEPCRGYDDGLLLRFWQSAPEVRTCGDLLMFIDRGGGPRAFLSGIGLRDANQARVLRETIVYIIDAQRRCKGPSEPARLKRWARHLRPGDYFAVGIKGWGLREFQRLRALLGANAPLPDDRVTRLIARLLRRPISKVQGLYLLERAGEVAGHDVRDVHQHLAGVAAL